MSEALEALERYGYHCNHYVNGEKDYKIIEKALKRLEIYEKRAELVATGNVIDINTIKLKALDIIKDTLGIELYYCEEIKQYLINIGGLVSYPLKGKEEYDLLKEVLK